jgi:hypothetical protein
MAGRQTVVPASMNQFALSGGIFAGASPPAGGIDAAGSGSAFATAWGANTGIQFINNGFIYLWYSNVTNAVTFSILIGQKSAGFVPLWSTEQVVTPTTQQYGWLGPWSPAGYTQQDASQHAASPGGVIGAGGVGFTCIDVATTLTNLAVRLYQCAAVSP